MAPSGGYGCSRGAGISSGGVNDPLHAHRVAERDDGFVESCGQGDEGLGHVVTIFDGDQIDVMHEIRVLCGASAWTSTEE